MASTIDELTVSYFEEGVETIKELNKEVLTKGAWTTIMFRCQNWSNKLQDYGPVYFSVRRYQKKNGEYKARSKFNISNVGQAEKIIAVLQRWIAEGNEQQVEE